MENCKSVSCCISLSPAKKAQNIQYILTVGAGEKAAQEARVVARISFIMVAIVVLLEDSLLL